MKIYRAVVMGTSTGGLNALMTIIPGLPKAFPLPIMITCHRADTSNDFMSQHLNQRSGMSVQEPDDKQQIEAGMVYIAPPNYHLLVEQDYSLSLSVDSKVNYSRPSIDVLFESAADAYGPDLVGVVLTGASRDGANGVAKIVSRGGLAIVQNPKTAESSMMPRMALEALNTVEYVLDLVDIPVLLCRLVEENLP